MKAEAVSHFGQRWFGFIPLCEAHNQLLQDELERLLSLLAEQAADKQNLRSNVVEKADAVLKYTRDYLNHQH